MIAEARTIADQLADRFDRRAEELHRLLAEAERIDKAEDKQAAYQELVSEYRAKVASPYRAAELGNRRDRRQPHPQGHQNQQPRQREACPEGAMKRDGGHGEPRWIETNPKVREGPRRSGRGRDQGW